MSNSPAPDVAEASSRQRTLAILIAILIAAVAARAASFSGFAAGDDAAYVRIASHVAQGEWPPQRHGALPQYPQRLGIILPTALAVALLGVNETAILLYPFAISVAGILLAYGMARQMFSVRAGLVAAACCAVLPLDCRFATWLLTDAPGAFWAGLGVWLCYTGSAKPSLRAKVLLGAGAGLCFGVSWLTRMSVAWLAPFIGIFLTYVTLQTRRNGWLFLAVALGSAAVFLGEGAFYAATRGDFLYRIHVTESMYARGHVWYFKPGTEMGWRPGQYWFILFKRLFKTGPLAMFLNWKTGFLPLLALIATLHSLRERRMRGGFAMAWFLASILMYNFGSASIRRYQPLPPIAAYLYPLFLPGVIVIGGWVDRMFDRSVEPALRRERRFWAVLVLLVGVIGCGYGLYQNLRSGPQSTAERRLARYARPESPLYADPCSLQALEFFWQLPARHSATAFTDLSAADIPPGSRVFINPRKLRKMKDVSDYQAPRFTAAPPAHWMPVWRHGSAVLYEVPQP